MVADEFIRLARVARVLIDAALANWDIQAHLADPALSRVWNIDGIRSNPTCRVEWEHAIVIGGIGESLAAARHKSWGPLIGIMPLEPEDPVHWCRILYLFKASSPYNRRFQQRQALKRILGRHHRPLVTRAVRANKRDFLAALTELDTHVIQRRLHLEPGLFWRAAKGKEFLDLLKPPVQLLLWHRWFDQGPSVEVDSLLIHEFGHEYCGDHLSERYYEALCRLGAKLKALALSNPDNLRRFMLLSGRK